MNITGVVPLIVVEDVIRSVAFYRKLGFTPVVQWPGYAKLTGGHSVIHLAAQGDPPRDRQAVALVAPHPLADRVTAIVVIQVADCRAACQQLTEAGVDLLGEATEPAWGGEIRAFLRDPDGHLIELNEILRA